LGFRFLAKARRASSRGFLARVTNQLLLHTLFLYTVSYVSRLGPLDGYLITTLEALGTLEQDAAGKALLW
jgi:hypothetical protein